MRRSKGPCDNRTDHPLAPKRNVSLKNDINSFCTYPKYNQKLLIRFFTKSLRFLVKSEKRVFMPRPVNKASHQVPTLFRKKGWIWDDFLYGKHFQGQKNQKGAKKFFEVNFLLLLHKLPNWSFGSSLFVYLKGILNFGFYWWFLFNNLHHQIHQNEGLVVMNGFSIKGSPKKHYKWTKSGFISPGWSFGTSHNCNILTVLLPPFGNK